MSQKNQLTTSDPLSYQEFTRFLDCLHTDKLYRWEAYALLSFCTACRVSDVLKLTWNDVLGKSRISIVEIKTKKAREIPINPSIQKRLHALWMSLECPERDEPIMKSNKKGGAYTEQHINRKLKDFKHKYRLNINNISTHTFRKTFGRYVYEMNKRSAESLLLLNKIFRHSSIEITKVYIGIRQEEINSIFSSLCV